MKTKIVITIRGGNVEAVHVSPDIDIKTSQIVILDYDNVSAGQIPTPEEISAEGEITTGKLIGIY